MVNVLVTMRCNRSCSYCFAKEKLHSYSESDQILEITIQNFKRVLDFIAKSGRNSLQLAGGEPTLHPQFNQMLAESIRRGMDVNLLSNGLWSGETRELLSNVSPTRLSFLLNIDHPDTYKPEEWKTINENLSALPYRRNVTLSFNIYEKEPRYDYIFDLLTTHGFKSLRLSFSMPVVFGSKGNSHIPISEYHTLTPYVMDFIARAESQEASVRIDNTVPACMFSQDELVALLMKEVLEPRRNLVCYPAIDIGPDLSVWRCFGTSGLFNRKLEEFESVQDIYEFFSRVFRRYQLEYFPLNECNECEYARLGVCQGGCIGFSVAKCMESGSYPLEHEEDILNAKLRLADSSSIRTYKIPEGVSVLSNENGSILEISPSMKRLLDLLSSGHTTTEAVRVLVNGAEESVTNDDSLMEFLSIAAREKTVPIISRLVDAGFLVNTLSDR